jgi:long-chain acyl-CoA synthetase
VVIAEDGEIQRTQCDDGILQRRKLTSEVTRTDSFHTGDIGIFDDQGFLKITIVKKKCSKPRRKIYCTTINWKHINNPFHWTNYGDWWRSKNAGSLFSQFWFYKEWAIIHEIVLGKAMKKLFQWKKHRIQEEIDSLNEKFGNWEKIKRFELTPDVWSIEGGQLTPTLKLKRKIVMEKYIDLFHKIYN